MRLASRVRYILGATVYKPIKNGALFFLIKEEKLGWLC